MTILKKKLFCLLLLSSISLLFGSCVKDNLDDCNSKVNIMFDYSWNMLKSNVFSEQVDHVYLYVFDANGKYLKTIFEKENLVQQENFTIVLPDLPTGSYRLVAWANSNNINSLASYFKFPTLLTGVSTIEELIAGLNKSDGIKSTFKAHLNNLLVGYSNIYISNESNVSQVVIPMKKVNNDIRVVLLDNSSNELRKDDFTIRIEETDGNGLIKYNYEVITGIPITYLPYYYEKTSPREGEYNSKNTPEKFNALAAEFSLSRLIESHNVRLIIEDREGKEVFNKNLLDLIYLLKEEGYLPYQMSFQEYLDRKDQFSLSVYINGDTSTWLDTVIIINGWVINLIDIDF